MTRWRCGREQYVLTQHFHVPIVEAEGLVRGCGRGVVGRMLVIEGIRDREVGQSCDADGRRMSDRRSGNPGVRLWGGDRFEWRKLKDLGFGIPVWKS
jgi:hypothetical protein